MYFLSVTLKKVYYFFYFEHLFIIFAGRNNKYTMSPRPKNIRKVNNMPSVAGFRPVISNNSCEETIFLHFEEYETIRLCDYEMKTQQEASISMGVSRPTLSRIYTSARQKIAKAFVCGAAIMIEGCLLYTSPSPRDS